jgi:HK97 family phage major capsid protein
VSAELARRSGRAFQGYAVPMGFEQRVDIVSTGLPSAGPGSNIIATDLRASEFIDILREQLVVRRLGARVLTGLTGNVAIPRLKQSATSYWFAENAAITASDVQLDQVTLSPKHCGALVEFSRNMLLQSSPDIEQLLRMDFAAVLARAIDRAAIAGGGSDEPSGVLDTQGIGDVSAGAAGGAVTLAVLAEVLSKVEQANAASGSLAWLTNFKVLAELRTTPKVASTDSVMLMDGATLMGYPVAVSSLVPDTLDEGASGSVLSALIFGDWSQLILGFWSELDVLVNPYESTAYTKGNVQVRGITTVDVAVRQPAAFSACKELTTA